MKKTVEAETGTPRTLMQAHEELVRIRPARDAPPHVWLGYYERSVSLYQLIAQIDPGHNGEARYWAHREHRRAREIAVRIGAVSTHR
ncbi:MAG: AMED_5909 family protein [Pseudonocardiaceae bacterium]